MVKTCCSVGLPADVCFGTVCIAATWCLGAGVWLLSRCADLAAFSYDVTRFWYAIKVLLYIGLSSRVAACLAMLTLHRDKSL